MKTAALVLGALVESPGSAGRPRRVIPRCPSATCPVDDEEGAPRCQEAGDAGRRALESVRRAPQSWAPQPAAARAAAAARRGPAPGYRGTILSVPPRACPGAFRVLYAAGVPNLAILDERHPCWLAKKYRRQGRRARRVSRSPSYRGPSADALAVCGGEPGSERRGLRAAQPVLLARLTTPHTIPCNGVEGSRSPRGRERRAGDPARPPGPSGPLVGFGAEPEDLGPDGVGLAIALVAPGCVADPGLPRPPPPGRDGARTPPSRRPTAAHPPRRAARRGGLAGGRRRASARSWLVALGSLSGDEAGLSRPRHHLGGDVSCPGRRRDRVDGNAGSPTDESTRSRPR